LREKWLPPQIATSLAAFRAAQERVDLRDAAISALRGLGYREQRVEREHEIETPDSALRGAASTHAVDAGTTEPL